MSNPRVRKLRESEEIVLKTSIQADEVFKKFNLKRYEWGEKQEKVAFLVHGWEGQTGNFASLVSTLIDVGYNIISFDAPSHGKSSEGKTHMFEFAEFLVTQFQIHQPEIIISHSFGSVNVAKALRQIPSLKVKLWLMITTPYNFKSRINQMADLHQLSIKVRENLIRKIEIDTQENIDNLNMATYCKEISNVKKGLIIHSKADKVLPIEGARKVHQSFTQSELIELENYGHYSILWAEELKSILAKQLDAISVSNYAFSEN